MVRLHEQLKYFTAKKVSTDEKWQNVQIVLSGHDVSFLPNKIDSIVKLTHTWSGKR